MFFCLFLKLKINSLLVSQLFNTKRFLSHARAVRSEDADQVATIQLNHDSKSRLFRLLKRLGFFFNVFTAEIIVRDKILLNVFQ